jgi:hypothetical protein
MRKPDGRAHDGGVPVIHRHAEHELLGELQAVDRICGQILSDE